MKKKTKKPLVRVSIRNADQLTYQQRQKVANWLIGVASHVRVCLQLGSDDIKLENLK